MDLKYILLVIGLILLIGTASAAGEPTNVGIDVPYEKTLTDTPMWFNATAENATAWFWDFGDGTNSTSQNVSKSFTAEGDYFVTLTATNEFGDTTIGREIVAMENVFASDGVGWTRATASAGWSGRYGHTSVVYDGKMWVMEGHDGSRKNDFWWSTDGITWTQATASAGWSVRYYHTSVVYDGKMWVMGGYHIVTFYNDVWFSGNSDTAIQHSIRDTLATFSTPLSSYNVASYQWQFGDGQTATGANPTHTYTESGTYTVTLTIPDEVNGLQTTYTKPITVVAGEGLTAGFTTSQRSGTPPLTVQFVDTSTGNPTAWAWNFGDGSATSNTRNPSHTYASIGSYTVSLYVENAEDSDWEVKTNYITVSSFPPIIASPTFNTTIQYDMANGTYLQYWLFNVTTFGDIPVYGFAYGIMAPLMNVWGYWVFVMFWLAYLFIVWIRTSDIGLPIIIGLLTAGVWGLFFPPEAMQFAYLMFGLSIAALLTKLAIEYI